MPILMSALAREECQHVGCYGSFTAYIFCSRPNLTEASVVSGLFDAEGRQRQY